VVVENCKTFAKEVVINHKQIYVVNRDATAISCFSGCAAGLQRDVYFVVAHHIDGKKKLFNFPNIL